MVSAVTHKHVQTRDGRFRMKPRPLVAVFGIAMVSERCLVIITVLLFTSWSTVIAVTLYEDTLYLQKNTLFIYFLPKCKTYCSAPQA